jgi:predicted permease
MRIEHWVYTLPLRLRSLFRRDRVEQELDEELRNHIERRTAQNIAAGMTPDDARTAALRAFGGIERRKEEIRETRGVSLIEHFVQDLTYALRGLRRSPGFAATIVVTLALGVGANAAIFSFMDRVFLRVPAGVQNAGGVHWLYQSLPDLRRPGDAAVPVIAAFSYPLFDAVRGGVGNRAQLAAFSPSDSESIGRGESAIPARVSYVTQNYFTVLGVRPARGRFFAPDEGRIETDPGVAVMSYALWKRVYGLDPGILGRKIEVSKRPYVVVGVTGEGFAGIEVDEANLFLPLAAFPGDPVNGRPWYEWIGNYLRVIARVPGGDDRALLAAGTVAYRRRNADAEGQLPPGTRPDTMSTLLAGPLVEYQGPSTNKPKELSISTRVAGIAVIVLLIACANVANLLLVRATQRRREVAVRLALGVSRARLFSQFLTESLVLAAIAGAGAIVVAAWGGSALRRMLLPTTHWTGPAVDPRVVGFTLGAAVLAGILAGLAPAFQGSRTDVNASLKSGGREGSFHRSRVRSALLVVQGALSVVLLVGAGLFVRSLGKVQAMPIGYAVDELAFATVSFEGFAKHDAERSAAFPRAAERIAAVPGVRGVALAQFAPMRGGAFTPVFLPGVDSLKDRAANYPAFNSVSPEFFGVTGMKIVAGRALTADDRRGAGGAIVVNETMAKVFWPGESALGKCVIIRARTNACSLVVGVAVDARQMRIIEEAKPQYFSPLRAAVDSETVAPQAIVIRTQADGSRAAGDVARTELRRLIPGVETVRIQTMAQSLEWEIRPWRLGAMLFTAFGLLALLVAAVGVYSVIAYSFSQREHELGVRVALGASLRDVYRLVLGEGFRVTAVGVALGVALALALGRLVAALLYGTSARDPLVVAGAAAILLVVGVAASLLPAWRAGKVDPMTALRHE